VRCTVAGVTAAYVAFRQISVSDVSGTRPNSVYYAYDQATNTYWAMAPDHRRPRWLRQFLN